MKNDTSPFHMERLLQKKLDFIWFSFLMPHAFVDIYVLMIATCVICITGKIFASPYKGSLKHMC